MIVPNDKHEQTINAQRKLTKSKSVSLVSANIKGYLKKNINIIGTRVEGKMIKEKGFEMHKFFKSENAESLKIDSL